MKFKGTLIATSLLFLIINTSYFWERNLGVIAFLLYIIFILYYLALVVMLIRHVFILIKNRFKQRQRVNIILFQTIIMLLILFFPAGIINFEQFEGRTILIAQNEGTANCTTTFKLKMGNKFTEKSICFGVNETRGNYKLIKDTIYFSNIKLGRGREEYYEFAVINKTDDKHILIRYRNSNDTIGVPITIIKSNI